MSIFAFQDYVKIEYVDIAASGRHFADPSHSDQMLADLDRFWFPRNCPFCNRELTKFQDDCSIGDLDVDQRLWNLHICDRCGWWWFRCGDTPLPGGNPRTVRGLSTLKRFDVDSAEVPLRELSEYLERNSGDINKISPARFEALVADVYRNVFGYKIEYCSNGSHDRGIDVVCVREESGKTTALQVKRYSGSIRLSIVHEFCGALVESNNKSGVLVTSSRFQSGCFDSAKTIHENAGIKIDLVDGKRFLEFLGLLNQSPRELKCPLWDQYGLTSLASPGIRVWAPKERA
jgi:hypothetical protein